MKVAIVGLACRLPGGVRSLETLWEVLENGRDAVSHIPDNRFDTTAFLHPRRAAPGRSCTFAAGVLTDIEAFDYAFFGLSRKEAEYMDPQQRLLLELAWEALEDAQIRPSSLAGTATGVYVGSSSLDASMQRADDPCVIGPYSMIGNTLSLLANRISYLLDARGPSMTIDTACSSSLVALHAACQSLASGESTMALVAGVHMLCSPLPFVGFSKAHMLSSDGRCKVFGADANGYVRAEGGGVLVLKPLADALTHGDYIHAIIDKTGVNTDGRTIGIAFPNQDAQMALLRAMYDDPAIDIRNLCYMEAHGTGTNAGDPVEARSIGEVFSSLRPGDDALPVGSIKSNLGHLEPASGIAGILKTVLVLRKGQVPPNPHLERLNPNIDFAALRLCPVTALTPVAATPGPRLAGVSSFGFGGANAHVILEQAPPAAPEPKRPATDALPPLLLATASQPSLTRLALDYAARLVGADAGAATDLVSSAALGRDQLSHRLVIRGADPATLAANLTRFATAEPGATDADWVCGETLGGEVKTAFAFSGNGGPWPGMGRAFLAADPDAGALLNRLDPILTQLLGWSVKAALLGDPAAQRLDAIEVVQPLQFSLQVCLFEALRAKGLVPDMVFGHSIGEVAAAYACGALSLEAACRVIAVRSVLQHEAYGLGGMAVAQLSRQEAEALPAVADGTLEIAAVNSPRYVTLSGPDDALDALRPLLRKRRQVFRKLDLRYPFHSRAMDPIQKRLRTALADLAPRPTGPTAFYSTVAGQVCPGTALGAEYWWQNIRQSVEFAAATASALADGARIFVEIGPDALLLPFLKASREEQAATTVALASVRRNIQDPDLAHALWQAVHVQGGRVSLDRLFPRKPAHVPLPVYPWDKEICQVAPTVESLGLFAAKAPAHPLLGRRVRGRLDVWENTLDPELTPFLADHRLDDEIVLPGAAYLEMALAAARELHGTESAELENVEYRHPLPLAPGQARVARLSVGPGGDFRIESRRLMQDSAFTLHVQGRIVPRAGQELPEGEPCPVTDPDLWGEPRDIDALYKDGLEAGLHFGPAFRPMRRLWRRGEASVVRLELAEGAAYDGAVLHPSLIDGAFQELLALADWKQKSRSPIVYLPLRTGRVLLRRPGQPALAMAELTRRSPRSLTAVFGLYDADGVELARIEDCRFILFQTRDNLARQQRIYALAAAPSRHPADPAPCPLPRPAALATRLTPVMAALADDSACQRHHLETIPFFTALMASRLHAVLSGLAPVGTTCLPSRLIETGQVAPGHRAYLDYALDFLVSMDLAERGPTGQVALSPCDLPPAETLWREAMRTESAQAEELALIGRWSQALEVGLGDPEAAADLLDTVRGGPLDRLRRDALAAALLDLRAGLDGGQSLRLLEIEAGSGELTAALLARLLPGSVAYLATDSDADRVDQLRVRFADQPGYACFVFDPDDAAGAPQDLAPGECDVVVAERALRRTDAPDLALARLWDLLRPGGLLLLLEDTPQPVNQLLHGLSPDWWRDTKGLPASRLATPGEWTALLGRAGFADTACLSGDPDDNDFFLLAAQKDPTLAASAVEPEPAKRRFVLLTDRAPSPQAASLAAALTKQLAAAGQTPVQVSDADGFGQDAPDHFHLDPARPEDWERLLTALTPTGDDGLVLELIHLMGYDVRQELPSQELAELAERRVISAAMLGRAFATAKTPAGLCLVTGGGVPLAGQDCRLVPSQGPLVGFGRVCINELPGLATRLVDVQADAAGTVPLAAAVREILCPARDHGEADREIVLTPTGRFGLRLAPLELLSRTDPGCDPTGEVALETAGQGRLDAAVWRRVAEKIPGPGQVRIDNQAAGVNYRDVMYTLGRIPEESLEAGASGPCLGLECAGTVTAVGEGVTECAVGDRVCCLTGAGYDSQILARAESVFTLPENLSFSEAATIPVAHFTAYYALTHLARLEAGERVLIHGAAGGVGQAAIQIAQMLGAKIYATAGSPAKRRLVADQGVTSIFDSRSLDFEDRIRAATDGQGVDVVLNSISGETLQKSLGLLKPLGRFLELGKVDFYNNSPLRMRLLRHNITFFGIDLDEVVKEKPALCRRLFTEMLERFAAGELAPLPHAVQPRAAVVAALRAMQQSSHVGKLIIVPDAVPASVKQAPPAELGPLSGQATYLVTGGLGGLGLVVANRLVTLGARYLVLVGRSGAATKTAQDAVAALAARGAAVTVMAVDLADPEALETNLRPALAALPPLTGIIHCAGVLRDATIANLDPKAVREVLRAKLVSAWNLHRFVGATPLDFFVLFSSATTVLGNPGQANYVAANTGLETLAAYRRSCGLRATSFGWGPISDVGMLSTRPEVMESLMRLTGAVGLPADTALDFVELFTRSDTANLHVFRMQLRKLSRLPYVASPVYDYLAGEGAGQGESAQSGDIRQQLRTMKPKDAVTHLATILARDFARILRLPASRIRHDKPLGELGMDSLMYVELGLTTEESFGVDISSLSLDKTATILTLASRIHQLLAAGSEAGTFEAASVAAQLRTQHGINLSEEATKRLLGGDVPAS